MKIRLLLLFICFNFISTSSLAERIYKSVDENGKVTYSSTPPEDSKKTEEVTIAPPPSEADVKAAQELHQRNEKTAEQLDENRQKRDQNISEENRLKREKQEQSKLQQQAEKNNDNQDYNNYPYYYPRRNPAGNRPIKPGPVIPRPHRPMISPR